MVMAFLACLVEVKEREPSLSSYLAQLLSLISNVRGGNIVESLNHLQ